MENLLLAGLANKDMCGAWVCCLCSSMGGTGVFGEASILQVGKGAEQQPLSSTGLAEGSILGKRGTIGGERVIVGFHRL